MVRDNSLKNSLSATTALLIVAQFRELTSYFTKGNLGADGYGYSKYVARVVDGGGTIIIR